MAKIFKLSTIATAIDYETTPNLSKITTLIFTPNHQVMWFN